MSLSSLAPMPFRPTGALVATHTSSMPHATVGRIRWTLPGEARLLVARGHASVGVTIGNRQYHHLPDIAVVGPTSKPRATTVDGEPPLELVLSALDWCALTNISAEKVADRVVTPADAGMTMLTKDIVALFDAHGNHRDITRVARGIIVQHTSKNAGLISQHLRILMRIVDEARITDAKTVANQVGVAPNALRRIALRQFGFPAKTVLIRRRFLLALEQFRVAGMDMNTAVSCGYFDSSHFLRDAKRFLGMTPRRFFEFIENR